MIYKSQIEKADILRTISNYGKPNLKFIVEENQKDNNCRFNYGKFVGWFGFAEKTVKDNGFNKIKIVKDNNYSSFVKRPLQSVFKKLA